MENEYEKYTTAKWGNIFSERGLPIPRNEEEAEEIIVAYLIRVKRRARLIRIAKLALAFLAGIAFIAVIAEMQRRGL